MRFATSAPLKSSSNISHSTSCGRRGRVRGPLHGIPILLKDNFDTKDMPTTGGCLALAGMIPKDDAFQVKKLRDSGNNEVAFRVAVKDGKVSFTARALKGPTE